MKYMDNPLFDSDSYKYSHPWQYPPGSTSMFAYYESRKKSKHPYAMLVGLQYIIKRYLTEHILPEHVVQAQGLLLKHGEPFHYEGWMHIATEHGGRLPLRIRAVPEGLPIPTDNVLMTTESTCEQTPWVVGWVETQLARVWGCSTVATRGREMKKLLYKHLLETCDDPDEVIKFALHCFGGRGVGAREVAALHSAGHQVNFMGTDTFMSIPLILDYYGTVDNIMPSFSLPAAEHSTISAWGRLHELEAFEAMLDTFGKDWPMVAVVSDTYDVRNAITEYWGRKLRDKVINMNAKLLVRLDSGDPIQGIKNAIDWLDYAFGSSHNGKGWKTLNHVGIVQGDAVTMESMPGMLQAVRDMGYSTEILSLGSGGGLLQKITRDDLDVAYKLSSITVDGQIRSVQKNPITDPGKASKPGRLDLILDTDTGEFRTMQIGWGLNHLVGTVMNTVFLNGEDVFTQNWNQVRENAKL